MKHIIFKQWLIRCACGDGYCKIADCPGPPRMDQIAIVRKWLIDDGEITIFPFSDPDLWKHYIKE